MNLTHNNKCKDCGNSLTGESIFFWVEENNSIHCCHTCNEARINKMLKDMETRNDEARRGLAADAAWERNR